MCVEKSKMNATCSHDFSKRVLMARIRWKPFVAAFAVLVVTLAIAVGPIIQDVNAKRRADVAAGEAAFWTSCASAAALVHLVASSTLSRKGVFSSWDHLPPCPVDSIMVDVSQERLMLPVSFRHRVP